MAGQGSLKAKSEYQRVYDEGIQEGFSVGMARQYYNRDRQGNIDPNKPQLEQLMPSTPYLFRGEPVVGYTVTDLSADQSRVKGDSLRNTVTHEFHVYAPQYEGGPDVLRNVDDLIGVNEKISFTDKNTGKDVSLNDAMDHMGAFAAAASEFPHVFAPDEYKEARSYLNGRLGLPMPTDDDYNEYLNNVENQLKQRVPFVGAVTNLTEMEQFRQGVGFPGSDQPTGPNTGKNDYGE